jgi:hypothetical protein
MAMRLVAIAVLLLSGSVQAAELPGGREEDAALARANPDEYAWTLFLALSRQARPDARGEADPLHPDATTYDDDRPVVWETWALNSGGRMPDAPHLKSAASETFPPGGVVPKPWEALGQAEPEGKSIEPILFSEIIDPKGSAHNTHGEHDGNEVRINRPGYAYIVGEGLYDLELLRAQAKAKHAPTFPPGTQVVKAMWVRIKEEDKPRYHWRTALSTTGEKEVWGLTGLHLMTKDLPTWFWADFEHEDFEKGALAPSVDVSTRGAAAAHGKDGVRAGYEQTKWAHYRLRGSQIDYVDAKGKPTVVANTQLERTFQTTSSCISCHVRAANDPLNMHVSQPSSLKPFTSIDPVIGPIGKPTPDWFKDFKGQSRSVSTDFLWGLVLRPNAAPKAPKAPKAR